MKKSFIIRQTFWTAALVLILSIAAHADVPVAAKPRVEREFKQLETAISRLIYNTVLPAPDVETMNRRIYQFMRDNPGVLRILRTNAAGTSINDISADSPQSEPSRDLSGQRWMQYVRQHKMPYYSMDYDPSGELTLFYAWPLMTGQDRSRFSGTFAAMIDFTAHVALIDDVEPFQLAYRGRVFFEHEWEDVDFNEIPLDVRGVSEVAIRTERPLPTRDQAAPPRRRAEQFVEETAAEETNDVPALSTTESDSKAKKKGAPPHVTVNALILAILAVIGALIAYSFIKNRISNAKRFARDDTPPPPKDQENRVIVQSMAEQTGASVPDIGKRTMPSQPTPPQSSPPPITRTIPALPSQSETTAAPAVSVDAEKITKMLALIKKEFAMMDKKMQIMMQRIEALEKR